MNINETCVEAQAAFLLHSELVNLDKTGNKLKMIWFWSARIWSSSRKSTKYTLGKLEKINICDGLFDGLWTSRLNLCFRISSTCTAGDKTATGNGDGDYV